MHDSTCAERLTPEFKTQLETIRQRRNAATHSVVAMVAPNVGVMIRDILEVAHNLIGERSWPRVVRDDAYSGPAPWSDYHGATQRGLLDSWAQTLELLSAGEYVRYLGFSKKQRLYLCPECHTGDIPPDPPIKLAHLLPNTPAAGEIYCFVCDGRIEVLRKKCLFCPGNVLLKEDGYPLCLSCNITNDERGRKLNHDSVGVVGRLLEDATTSDGSNPDQA